MDNFHDSNVNNSLEYPLQTNSTFLIEPTLESELKKLLEDKNKSRDIKLDKISFLSKNIQSIGNGIPLIFCNITRLYLSNNNIISLEGIEQFANLTHLSISYNLIEDIYELNHIINPEILLHLNVKGNFFCKNPSFEEVILNLFINLKSLDDLKINNMHKKMIKYGHELSKYIMMFLLDIEEKINKISIIKNVCNLNNEYDLINSSNNNLQEFNKDNLNSLIEEFNNIDEISIYQILSLINEKRIINNNNYLPPINDLNHLLLQYLNNTSNNLITSENDKMKEIYSILFSNLILKQRRKDYRGFLNYLIMTSEPKLFEFIKTREDNLKYMENDKTSINLLCQNFEKILIKYSDYTLENIKEIQMMIFYFYFNGNNILSDNENDIGIFRDQETGVEKIILNNYEQKVINFREIIPDYFPIFPLDEEFMKYLMNFFKEKLNIFTKYINEMKQIKQKDKLQKIIEPNISDKVEKKEENNDNNYDVELINANNNETDNINLNINSENIQNSNDNRDYNTNNQDDNDIIETNNINNQFNLNKPFIYNSQNDFFNNQSLINNNNNNNEKNMIYVRENINNLNENNQNINIQNSPRKIKKTNKIKNDIISNVKPNQEKIQMKYNIIQLSRILSNIFFIKNIIQKKIAFMKSLKKIQYLSKIIQLFNKIQTILDSNKLKKFLALIKKVKKIKKNKSRSKSKNKSKNKSKIFEKKEIDEEIDIVNNKALLFYYLNLKKKIFLIFKYNKFCKKENIKQNEEFNIEQNNNIYNNSNESDIYAFFHGKKENKNIIDDSNNNKINLNNHNNSININNIIDTKSVDYLNEKIIQIESSKDKTNNNASQLRKILGNQKEIIEEENTDEVNIYNTQPGKDEVDELLNNLKNLYKEIEDKNIKSSKSTKSTKSGKQNEYEKKNKEYINKLREVREKEKEKAKNRQKKLKCDQNKLLGCPNFIKNTYSSVLKNIY